MSVQTYLQYKPQVGYVSVCKTKQLCLSRCLQTGITASQPASHHSYIHTYTHTHTHTHTNTNTHTPHPHTAPTHRTHTQTFNIQQIPKPLMINDHVINSSSCGLYSTTWIGVSKHYPKRAMLNFRDRSLRMISTVRKRRPPIRNSHAKRYWDSMGDGWVTSCDVF